MFTKAISDFNSLLTLSILLSKSFISDFNSPLTFYILLENSLNFTSILLSSSTLNETISEFKLRSNISNFKLKLLSKYSISLYVNSLR
ncbi:hypothetical protein bcCo53_001561 (plasmid) [Borrelia coriaceae]|nr:hypothetical protein bcCo53_001561 [Borrelia coriaceae]